MSWFATKHAWRVTSVDKGTKMVLLALAFRIPQGYSSTEPTSLGMIERLTGYDPRHLRRCLDELVDAGEIARLARGKLATYHFVTMEGPLFAGHPRKTDTVSAFPQQSHHEKPDAMSGNHSDTMSEKNRTLCPPAGGVSISSQVLSTEVLDDNNHAFPTDIIASAHALFDWWIAAFPTHRGAPAVVDIEEFGPVAAELLTKHRLGVATIQAMAVCMWAIEDVRVHKWIPTTDYSIKVLRETAPWLVQRVSTRPAPADDPWQWCAHFPKCASREACAALAGNREAVS